MFYFGLDFGFKYRRISFESHIVWKINDNIFQNLLQNGKKTQGFLRLKFNYSSLLAIILSAILLSCVLSRVVYENNVQPHVPRGIWGGTLSEGTQVR